MFPRQSGRGFAKALARPAAARPCPPDSNGEFSQSLWPAPLEHREALSPWQPSRVNYQCRIPPLQEQPVACVATYNAWQLRTQT